ncbi:hypothetical protein Csa_016513 [Cucumis sativus]|uniref:Uncharacterized protein n=1 Tax=Cucumis sativus TaxID=3659 RepID=A0A0A0K884_CUCSA|nr:hypothetical protein Csa_016513 [Cucumis sativus]
MQAKSFENAVIIMRLQGCAQCGGTLNSLKELSVVVCVMESVGVSFTIARYG